MGYILIIKINMSKGTSNNSSILNNSHPNYNGPHQIVATIVSSIAQNLQFLPLVQEMALYNRINFSQTYQITAITIAFILYIQTEYYQKKASLALQHLFTIIQQNFFKTLNVNSQLLEYTKNKSSFKGVLEREGKVLDYIYHLKNFFSSLMHSQNAQPSLIQILLTGQGNQNTRVTKERIELGNQIYQIASKILKNGEKFNLNGEDQPLETNRQLEEDHYQIEYASTVMMEENQFSSSQDSSNMLEQSYQSETQNKQAEGLELEDLGWSCLNSEEVDEKGNGLSGLMQNKRNEKIQMLDLTFYEVYKETQMELLGQLEFL